MGGGEGVSSAWCFSDPEITRRRWVASYKAYSVEGKVDSSLSRGFHGSRPCAPSSSIAGPVLMYHYFAATEIYNAIPVFICAYVWMTGFGNFSYYYIKKDFSLARFAQDKRSKSWRVQAVSVARGRFESRKALPEKWRGMRDDELSQETGIPGCVFVHMSGFIGGNVTNEGALEMARAALKC